MPTFEPLRPLLRAVATGIAVLMLASCRISPPPAVILREVKADTLHAIRLRQDSVVQRDSICIERSTEGDTVKEVRTEWRWRERIQWRTDTLRQRIFVQCADSSTVQALSEAQRTAAALRGELHTARRWTFALGTLLIVALLLLWLRWKSGR